MKKLSSPFVIIKKAFEIFTDRENFISLLKVYLPIGILFTVSLFFTYIPYLSKLTSTYAGGIFMTVFNLFFAFLMVFINLAGIIAIINIQSGKSVDARKIFNSSFSKFWRFLLLSLIIYLLYALGLVLLILPFFLVATWFAFSKFIMIDRGVGVKESLFQSKKIVKGRFWKILSRIIAFGLFTFVAQLFLGTMPYEVGTLIFYLFGGLFILPGFLLYKEVSEFSAIE